MSTPFNRALAVTFASATLFAMPALAELTLPALFSDHMVLQRGREIPVWGWAGPGDKVAVEFAGQSGTATTDAEGKWSLKLKPLRSSKNPGTLVVSGKRTIEIRDVLVGEVWIASGQSNMWWPVRRAGGAGKAINAAGQDKSIRLFQVPGTASGEPRTDVEGQWAVSSPASVKDFSAVAYFFGKEIAKELDVPVGLIHASVRGTVVETWMSGQALRSVGAFTPVPSEWDRMTESRLEMYPDLKSNLYDCWTRSVRGLKAYMDRWEELREKGLKDPRKAMDKEMLKRQKQDRKVQIICKHRAPSSFYNGMIHPLAPFAVRGVIWYQGESNALREDITIQRYQKLLTGLIKDWRALWGQGDFPFLVVGIANFQPIKNQFKNGWPLVRQAQFEASRALPDVGFANTIDIGEARNVHARNKKEVGRRLALIALQDVYGKSVVSSGPVFAGVEQVENGFLVRFEHADGGLKTSDDGPVKGFVVAGRDKTWKAADATLKGTAVIITCGAVKDPLALRYAWEDNPAANLCNGENLPAVPFSTAE